MLNQPVTGVSGVGSGEFTEWHSGTQESEEQ